MPMTRPSTHPAKIAIQAAETTPMTARQYEQAATALAALIRRWAATAASPGGLPDPDQRSDTGHPGPPADAGPPAERHAS
jgi:hypothetical protein